MWLMSPPRKIRKTPRSRPRIDLFASLDVCAQAPRGSRRNDGAVRLPQRTLAMTLARGSVSVNISEFRFAMRTDVEDVRGRSPGEPWRAEPEGKALLHERRPPAHGAAAPLERQGPSFCLMRD